MVLAKGKQMKLKFPLLIDGGLSNVLEEQGCNLDHELWSARLLEKNPEAIVDAHYSYLEHGAQCITTSSYQASIKGFTNVGYDKAGAEKLILQSVELAELAVQQFSAKNTSDFKPLIAASIGPYGAYLADGSEYRGNYSVSDEELLEFHHDRIQLLDRSNADFLACETIPSFREAKVLSELLKSTKKTAWMSFSCKDEQHLNDGTNIEECIRYLANHPHIFALGVNCTAPKYISGLNRIVEIKKSWCIPIPEKRITQKAKSWIGISDPISFVEMCREWVELGADIIGGCCRIGPDHIQSIDRALHKNK